MNSAYVRDIFSRDVFHKIRQSLFLKLNPIPDRAEHLTQPCPGQSWATQSIVLVLRFFNFLFHCAVRAISKTQWLFRTALNLVSALSPIALSAQLENLEPLYFKAELGVRRNIRVKSSMKFDGHYKTMTWCRVTRQKYFENSLHVLFQSSLPMVEINWSTYTIVQFQI